MTAEAAVVLPVWLNKDFAKSSLKESNSCGDFKILSVDVQRATAPGDNYLSEVYRMTVHLEHNVKQYKRSVSLIIKCLPDSEVMKTIAQDMQAFEQETLMFCETIPAMSKILEEAAPGKYTQLSAKCFASGREPVSYVVLEDLKARGFALAKRCKGLDLAHARLVVRKLAEFHASSVRLYEQRPSALDRYQTFRMFEGDMAKHLEPYVKQGCKLLADQLETLEKSYSKYAPKVRALSENIFPRLLELVKRKGKFRVLTHADTWVNNIMFKYAGGVVRDVVLLDFQLASYNSPSIDLQYFTHTSLTEEVYSDHLTDLLKEYHNHLVEVMSDIGVSTDKQISFEELLEDFEEHCLYAVFASVGVLPVVRTEEETRFDVESSVKENDSDTNRKAFAGASYVEAVKQMLPQFEKKGLFSSN
ncbi:uncharacterized protein LOC126092335 [Schistocerca cancellata]|uniref:uncharacterized protein LOC126092335 n=1 Tax=Schistocerca cancellata TaxID=274614 RepID=UPI002118E1BB|nr:uncharacterized protein LOC126092335 [Schistocerca cancellata]XP_049763830.1 uncharacterized protein LOC126092335 [Schistocerca cancellata]XP_049763831.1 uncharacterized protein LOC126092335 [Schistocerca cancellata]